ncbi:hypothetical protein ACEZCY_36120 [Streptacidiphilus sp. N1-12]|uniref:Uncharacterized protein n=1 Tax=Streptacidiphilus alkalitolerans TaxID=3342712 RepID=A0ABV6WRK4_9ACTN
MHRPSVPEQPAAPARERCEGQIVRVTQTEARVAFPRWCAGAATVTVSRADLVMVLGLDQELLGARVSAVIDTAALTETGVLPVAWRCAAGPGQR